MPRKMKKMDSMESVPSRQEVIPGPAVEKKASKAAKPLRLSGEQLSGFEKSFQKKLAAAEELLAEREHLFKMEPTEENSASLESARLEVERQRKRLEKTQSRQAEYDESANTIEEAKEVKAAARRMAKAIDQEPKQEKTDVMSMVKELQETEEQRMMAEEVLGIETPKKRAKKETAPRKNPRQEMVDELVEMESENQKKEASRKEMEDLDREWAERIKRDIEESEGKTAELHSKNMARAENMQKAREIARNALETYKKETLPRLERQEAVEEIRSNIRAERKSAEMDPARKRSLARLKKMEGEHYNIGLRLHDLTGMTPDEAYEKLVLNAGMLGRIRRGLANLANVPTYKLLDEWFETGKKVEALQNEVTGIKPDLGQQIRARGKSQMLEVEEAAEQATDRLYMQENPDVAAIDADYKKGVVRDAEGAVIEDEKKIRAKRPQSRVPARIASTGTPTIEQAVSSRAARVEPIEMEESGRMSDAEVKLAIDAQEYQKSRSAEINTVRKEYLRAAELWNSIQSRLQGTENERLDRLYEVYGTRDIATAYVLDRAFYDMDGDQEAKARLDRADKILGIQEVSPAKKVRPKMVKKAA
jgi:hypothetical protein